MTIECITDTHSDPAGTPDRKPIRRALLSVTDKTGVIEFARALHQHSIELISTGGTARTLREAGLPVRDIADLTGFPEMLDGRVKTLHPKVHGALLHVRSNPEHIAAIQAHAIEPIDLVVVNLYAFEATAAKPGVTLPEIIENIDIGGPSMIRSAAKNWEDVAVVTSAADYPALAAELADEAEPGTLTRTTRWRLAVRAFATTAAYDSAIATTLEALQPDGQDPTNLQLPATLRLHRPRAASLRYGENPHQAAALYVDGTGTGIAGASQLQGKELSYNNLVDLDACWELVSDFPSDQTAVVIIKHTNPCGAATGTTVLDAYQRALAADPISAFGGVLGINREVDVAAAEEIAKLFVEAIVAPGYTPQALERFAVKKNLRLIKIAPAPVEHVVKQISGGFLLQHADRYTISAAELTIPTARRPSDEELRTLLFAWTVCKHVKSNAIVYARSEGAGTQLGFQTVGIGAGQMSRVDAARFGAMKAVLPLQGTVAASDAFFPFPDGLELIAQAGATAIIQPGGSVRDAEVIAAADRLRVAMAFTGIRHFRHG